MSARLDAIVRRLDGLVVRADAAMIDVTDVEHDSRAVAPGALFACIPGNQVDGHDFAEAAVAAGAVALLVQRPLALPVPQIEVSSVRRAVGPAAAEVHGDVSTSIPVIGVTGTNGKTTTVRIITSLLGRLGVATGEIGTLTGARTTPEAPELQRMLASMRREGMAAVAMEVSSHALEQRRVDGMRFRVAGFTNLGIDHLDHHGDLESYFKAKAMLFDVNRCDLAVVDVSATAGERLASQVEVPLRTVDGSSVSELRTGPLSSTFVWSGHPVRLSLGGDFNVANAVLAAEIVVALGHDAAAVAEALEHVPAIPGRFEPVDEGQDFAVIVDFAHSPDGLEALLGAARAVADRSVVVVFGAGGDRDTTKRPQMGEVARRLADRVVVTSDNPRGEDPDAIIAGIVSGMDTGPDLIEPDRRHAIRHALAGARAGDVVLIAGKGHETTQTIGADVFDFDDRVVAREELQRLGGMAS